MRESGFRFFYSAACWDAPTGAIALNFGMLGDIAEEDVVAC